MTKKDKELVKEVMEEEEVIVEEPVPEPEPKPEPKKQGTKGEVIYTANGPMYKKADGTLIPKLD
jgi:hypothetical protein